MYLCLFPSSFCERLYEHIEKIAQRRKKSFNNNSRNLQFNHNKIIFIFLKKKNLLMRQSKGQPHFEEKSTFTGLVIQISGLLTSLVYSRWSI